MIIDAALLTQAHIDEAKEGCAHVLVSIGYLGGQKVYMDQDLETIRTRFRTEFHGNGEIADIADYTATVVGFDDTFETYELRD
jgi:Cft2 family RNA processing exonuclease